MTPADVAAAHAVGEQVHLAFPERIDVMAERQRLAPDDCFVLAGPEGIAGYLISHPWAGPPPPLDTLLGALPPQCDHLFLHDLALLEAVRKGGHGQAILRHFAGRPAIALIAVSGSQPFWAAQGFVKAPLPAEKRASYGADAVYMRRVAL